MGDHPDRAPILLENALVFGVLAFSVVTYRLGFRAYKRWTDGSDLCLAIALISSLCQDAFNATCYIRWGYGQHKADLPSRISHSEVPLKLFWLNQIFFKVTTLFTKLSLCVVYLGLLRRANSKMIQRTRTVIYITMFIVVTSYGSAFLISIFECTPVSKIWQAKEPRKCINMDDFRYYTAVVNLFTSVLVIGTPLPALFRIKHRGREVTQVIFLILLGLIHTGCTIGRLVIMVYPPSDIKTDPQWANTPANILALIEMNVGIIAASLVVMRPCFQALYNVISRRPVSSNAGSRPKLSGYGSSTNGLSNSLNNEKTPRKENVITRTIDIQLSTRSASSEEVLRNKNSFPGDEV